MRGFLIGATTLLLTASSTDPRFVDADEVKDLVREEQGQVVLLNFWATWCLPCLVEFPEIVAIEKAYRDRGLRVLSVSADTRKRVDSDLLPFLAKHPPNFPIYVMQTDDVEEFMHRIDPDWNGNIPATFFINRKGSVVSKRFSAMSREQMEQALDYLFEVPEP